MQKRILGQLSTAAAAVLPPKRWSKEETDEAA